MYAQAIFAAGALLSAVAAVPLEKRDIIWTTQVDYDITTIDVTTTIWVSQGFTAPASAETTSLSHFGHHHGHKSSSTASTTAASAIPVSESTASTLATEATPTTSAYVAPTSTSSISVAPSPTTTYEAPTSTYEAPTSTYEAPTSTYVAPTSTYEAPSTTSAAPAASSSAAGKQSGGSSGSSGSYSGQLTYYTVGTGSCGWTNTDSEAVVAVAEDLMQPLDGANPNDNPWCGKMITITANGVSQSAKIVDTCPGCAAGGLDLSPTLFTAFAPLASGVVTDMTWSFS